MQLYTDTVRKNERKKSRNSLIQRRTKYRILCKIIVLIPRQYLSNLLSLQYFLYICWYNYLFILIITEIRRLRITWVPMGIRMPLRRSRKRLTCLARSNENTVDSLRKNGPPLFGCRKRSDEIFHFFQTCISFLKNNETFQGFMKKILVLSLITVWKKIWQSVKTIFRSQRSLFIFARLALIVASSFSRRCV